jgi:hypothetical protein
MKSFNLLKNLTTLFINSWSTNFWVVTRRLLRQPPKLQKGEARLQSHGLALPIPHDPRATRVFVFHGSASLHLPGTRNART